MINVITAGDGLHDRSRDARRQTLPRVVGVAAPVNIGTFNVWIIYPRGDSDVTLQ